MKLTGALVPLVIAGLLLAACSSPEQTDDDAAAPKPSATATPQPLPTATVTPTPAATPVLDGEDGDGEITNLTAVKLVFYTDYIVLVNSDGQAFDAITFGTPAIDAAPRFAAALGASPTTVTVPEGEYFQGYSGRPGYGFAGLTIFPEYMESGFFGRRFQVIVTAATSNGVVLETEDGIRVGSQIADVVALYPKWEPWTDENGVTAVVADPKHQDYNWTYFYAENNGTAITKFVMPTGA